jgi:hypothetical protein
VLQALTYLPSDASTKLPSHGRWEQVSSHSLILLVFSVDMIVTSYGCHRGQSQRSIRSLAPTEPLVHNKWYLSHNCCQQVACDGWCIGLEMQEERVIGWSLRCSQSRAVGPTSSGIRKPFEKHTQMCILVRTTRAPQPSGFQVKRLVWFGTVAMPTHPLCGNSCGGRQAPVAVRIGKRAGLVS